MNDEWRDFGVLLLYTGGCMAVLAANGALTIPLAVAVTATCIGIGVLLVVLPNRGCGWSG